MTEEFDIYKSKPFIEYYQKLNGSRINIDFNNRVVEIYDQLNNLSKKVHFSSQIIREFNKDDLLNSNVHERNKIFYVFIHGKNGFDWLWFYGDLINISELL